MSFISKYWWVGTAILWALLGWYTPILFPQNEAILTNWQLNLVGEREASQDVVLIEMEQDGPLSCGQDRWNHHTLATLITTLTEAGASVIAPLLPLRGAASPPCGGMRGDAVLTTSFREGNIILPSNTATMFTTFAKAVGHTELDFDDTRVLSQFPSSIVDKNGSRLPWAQVVAATYVGAKPEFLTTIFSTSTRKAWLQWTNRAYSRYSFLQVQPLLQGTHFSGLRHLVQGKIVALAGTTDSPPTIPTSKGNKITETDAQLELLQQALVGHGPSRTSPTFLMLLLGVLSIGGSFFVIRYPFRLGMYAVIGMALGYGITLWVSLSSLGLILPLAAPLMTILTSTMLTCGFKLWSQQGKNLDLITTLEQQVADLLQKLSLKERHMNQLAEQLNTAATLATQPTGMQDALTPVRREWEKTTIEVEQSRQQLHKLEARLSHLRQTHSPQILEGRDTQKSSESPLQQECRQLGILTHDPTILRLFSDLKKAAKTSSPVLITGETGTGKEVFANALHALSPWSQGPLVAINVAAIRPELFESELFGHVRGAYTGAVGAKGFVESANHGTLFLDEIGDIPTHTQVKLLRLLEDGTFYRVGEARTRKAHIRIVAATNHDLWQDTQQGRFREDLYYRLSVFSFHLPPLRERSQEDRIHLAETFLRDTAQQLGREGLELSQGAMEAICAASWPGNLRELKQTLIQAATLTDESVLTERALNFTSHPIEPVALPLSSRKVFHPHRNAFSRQPFTRDDASILHLLRKHEFDIQATARALQWDRSTVTQRLKGMGFQALVRHHGNVTDAAEELAGTSSMAPRVRGKLQEYSRNLLAMFQDTASVNEALHTCRRRMKNLPERYFSSVETLIHWSQNKEIPKLD